MMIALPIGGRGQRFRAAGYTIPKPFLPLDGKPLVQHAIDSYAALKARWVIIYRYEYERVLSYCPNLWYGKSLTRSTRGPLETLLCASDSVFSGYD